MALTPSCSASPVDYYATSRTGPSCVTEEDKERAKDLVQWYFAVLDREQRGLHPYNLPRHTAPATGSQSSRRIALGGGAGPQCAAALNLEPSRRRYPIG